MINVGRDRRGRRGSSRDPASGDLSVPEIAAQRTKPTAHNKTDVSLALHHTVNGRVP
jgi:hypothetical protein